jgi:hypothetical protein
MKLNLIHRKGKKTVTKNLKTMCKRVALVGLMALGVALQSPAQTAWADARQADARQADARQADAYQADARQADARQA